MSEKISKIEGNLLNEGHELFKLLKNDPPSWWKDVKEDKDLYVDIRKMNLIEIYYKGGRAAKLELKRGGLAVTAHPKYIGKGNDPKCYKKSKDGHLNAIYQDCEKWLCKNKLQELKSNIRKFYESPEKEIQGRLVIENRDKYLDTEFQHRLYDGKRESIRIDLVKIEGEKIIFVELKRIDDSRLHTTKDEDPEIISQMTNYREFLKVNKDALTDYYKTLYNIKASLGLPVPKISNVSSLTVNPEPVLLIKDYEVWNKRRKIRKEKITNTLERINVKYEFF